MLMIVNLKNTRKGKKKIIYNFTTQRSLSTFGSFFPVFFSIQFYTVVVILIFNFDFLKCRSQLFYHIILSIINKTLNGRMISMKPNSHLTITF